jgi:hypothetical protein|tara:strand:- start:492 stop:596 length:105 start_codon:yes stop_codon:yes gene_type:complete
MPYHKKKDKKKSSKSTKSYGGYGKKTTMRKGRKK